MCVLLERIDVKVEKSDLLNEPSCSGLFVNKTEGPVNQSDEIVLLDSSSELDSAELDEKTTAQASDGDDVVIIDDDIVDDDQRSKLDEETINVAADEIQGTAAEQPTERKEAGELVDVFQLMNENEELFTNADGGILLPQSGDLPSECDTASVAIEIDDDRSDIVEVAGNEDANDADVGLVAEIDEEIAVESLPAELIDNVIKKEATEDEVVPELAVKEKEAEKIETATDTENEPTTSATVTHIATTGDDKATEIASTEDGADTTISITAGNKGTEIVKTADKADTEIVKTADKADTEIITIGDDAVAEIDTAENKAGTTFTTTEDRPVTDAVTNADIVDSSAKLNADIVDSSQTNKNDSISEIVKIEDESSTLTATVETESVTGNAIVADQADVTAKENEESNNKLIEQQKSHEDDAESVVDPPIESFTSPDDIETIETDPNIVQTIVKTEKSAEETSTAAEQIDDVPSTSGITVDKSNYMENSVAMEKTIGQSKTTEEAVNKSDGEGSNTEGAAAIPIINIDGDSDDDDNAEFVCAERLSDGESAKSPELSHKECINSECTRKSTLFSDAPEFAVNYYHLTKRMRYMHICEECFQKVLDSYGMLCAAIEDKQPLFAHSTFKQPSVEILDSSDDEDHPPTKKRPKQTFDTNTLTLIENELDDIIKGTFNRIDIKQQMDWNRQIIDKRIQFNKDNSEQLGKEMADLKKLANTIYYDTYRNRSNFIEHRPSLDLNTGLQTQLYHDTYPPVGEVDFPEWKPNRLCYSFRRKQTGAWMASKVVKIERTIDDSNRYTIQFTSPKKEPIVRIVNRKQMAYGRAPEVRLAVGNRVIALATETDEKLSTNRLTFYPGTIAEPLSKYNQYRYLVFFDDGYVQYVEHDLVRLISETDTYAWESIENIVLRTFIKDYIENYKRKRAFINARIGQRIQTELDGKWVPTVVTHVDASLIKVAFETVRRSEWIYRGSTRIFTLYKQFKKAQIQKEADNVEYMEFEDNKEPTQSNEPPSAPPQQQPQPEPSTSTDQAHQRTFASQANRDSSTQQKRSVAKKSSAAPQKVPAILNMNNSTIYVDEDKPKGKVVYYTAKKQQFVTEYKMHQCNPQCMPKATHNLKAYSPLSKPLLSGWERQLNKTKTNRKSVSYRAPCGRRLRDMRELHKFLRKTKCTLNVDNFDFDPLVYCLAEYVIDSYVYKKPDISEGAEGMNVQYINCYDSSKPPPCQYSSIRIPNEGVPLNLDPEFMCGCDCEDDCSDKEKCQCWQLTLAGAKYLDSPDTPIEKIGYEYKRLNEPIQTGIYECNSRCKCNLSCLNRVVQQPLQLKLQVFKTMNRGWGIRCLNDIPKGEYLLFTH